MGRVCGDQCVPSDLSRLDRTVENLFWFRFLGDWPRPSLRKFVRGGGANWDVVHDR